MTEMTFHAEAARCPSCDAELAGHAVLCVACGYHLGQGAKLVTAVVLSEQEVPDTSNPYQTPVDSATDQSFFHIRLSTLWIHGRIPRWQWWGVQLVAFAVIFLLGGLLENGLIPEAAVVIAFWVVLWIVLMAQIKRWHDLDKSGCWCLVNLIPLLGSLYAVFELGFNRGTEGPNDYGDDPLS